MGVSTTFVNEIKIKIKYKKKSSHDVLSENMSYAEARAAASARQAAMEERWEVYQPPPLSSKQRQTTSPPQASPNHALDQYEVAAEAMAKLQQAGAWDSSDDDMQPDSAGRCDWECGRQGKLTRTFPTPLKTPPKPKEPTTPFSSREAVCKTPPSDRDGADMGFLENLEWQVRRARTVRRRNSARREYYPETRLDDYEMRRNKRARKLVTSSTAGDPEASSPPIVVD